MVKVKNKYMEYEPEELKKLQSVELSILSDFIDMCLTHDIDYFIWAGSAIGAIRNQGFIPWDDDIDVAFFREDYEKFLKIYEQECKDKYTFFSPDTENKYYNFVPNISLNGTKFTVDLAEGLYDTGIFVDLFIYENVPDDLDAAAKHIKKCQFWRNLYVAARSNFKTLKKGAPLILKIKYYISDVLRFLFKIIDPQGKWMYKQYLKQATKYNGKTNTYSVPGDPNAINYIITKEDLYPYEKVKFESLEVNIPNGYDYMLKKRYGNYMEVPPESQRVNHAPIELDLGDN